MNANAGRAFAWLGFALGICASVAANVFHSYLATETQLVQVKIGSLLISAFWPIALYICLEIIARVNWPGGFWYWAARYLGLGSVASISAYVSYEHLHGLLVVFSEEKPVTYLAPVAIDGLMLLASAALIALAGHARQPVDVVAETIMPAAEPRSGDTSQEAVVIHPELSPPDSNVTSSEVGDYSPTIHELARQAYIDSTHNGHVLTSTELGAMFKRSPRWARDQIRKAKEALA